jgi:hypothetical protein
VLYPEWKRTIAQRFLLQSLSPQYRISEKLSQNPKNTVPNPKVLAYITDYDLSVLGAPTA